MKVEIPRLVQILSTPQRKDTKIPEAETHQIHLKLQAPACFYAIVAAEMWLKISVSLSAAKEQNSRRWRRQPTYQVSDDAASDLRNQTHTHTETHEIPRHQTNNPKRRRCADDQTPVVVIEPRRDSEQREMRGLHRLQ